MPTATMDQSREADDSLLPAVIRDSQEYKPPFFRRMYLKIFPIGFKVEFFEVLALAWPAVITSFFQTFLQTVSIIMCGHLSKSELAAAGLANSMINVFGIAVGLGMSTACDTLFSQTFGSENKKRVGIYLQRSLLIMNMAAAIVCCVHFNIEPILLLFGQNPEIAHLSAKYMLCFLPGVFFEFNFLILARYLQNQNIVYPSMICAFIGNVVNIVSQYVCIYVLGFSYLSSAICEASSLGVIFFTQLIYIFYSKVYTLTWDGWNWPEALRDWWMFISLGLSGVFMVGLEEWSFEIATFVAGALDTVQLGIQSILFQMEALCYMLPLGVSIAINIRVGQHLGANRPQHAKTAYRVGTTLILITATFMAVLIVSTRSVLPYAFTNDKAIASGASEVLILNAGFQYSDGLSATAAGALRGCGRQLTGAIILFIGYYVISLPVGMSLAFLTPLKIFGFWVGLLIGISLESLIFIVVVGFTDWRRECEKAALVAYGYDFTENSNDQKQADDIDITDFVGETDAAGEEEPLLGQRKRRHRSTASVTSTSFRGRRASIAAAPVVDIEDTTMLSEQQLKALYCKRVFIFFLLLAVIIGAVIARIFQAPTCYPVNNATMPDYGGFLRLCNETSL